MESPQAKEVAPFSNSAASDGTNRKDKKRKWDSVDANLATSKLGMDSIPSLVRQPELPEFNLTSERPPSQDAGSPTSTNGDSKDEWQTVINARPSKKVKKIPKKHSNNYPQIKFSPDSRLNTQLKIGDLQNLVLYILADGTSPQFVSIRHRNEIRKVVVLMVPGLEMDMFKLERKEAEYKRPNVSSPEYYYPSKLKEDELPLSLKHFAEIFEHIWPVKTPGDDKYGKMHSPLHAMLTAPMPKSKEEKKWNGGKNGKGRGVSQAKEPEGWKNTRTRVTEFIHDTEELLENDYTLHPAAYITKEQKAALIEHRSTTGSSTDEGWVDTSVTDFEEGTIPEKDIEDGSITAGKTILAMDCEMCMTGEKEFSLTRISIVGWDGSVVLDELVVPDKPIVNYLTQSVNPSRAVE
jgi:RNA exonuclease 1